MGNLRGKIKCHNLIFDTKINKLKRYLRFMPIYRKYWICDPCNQFLTHGVNLVFNRQRSTLFVIHSFSVISIFPHFLASLGIFFISFIQIGLIFNPLNITHIGIFFLFSNITSIIEIHSQYALVEQKDDLFFVYV